MPTQSRQPHGERTPERRRTKRVPLSFQIQVSGFDERGEFFRDQTVTKDVSEGGCQFSLPRRIEPKTPITLQITQRDGVPQYGSKPVLFEVVRMELTDEGCTVGAMQLQAHNIWNMSFPQNRAQKPTP